MKRVSATIIIICMAIYGLMLNWLFKTAHHVIQLDIPTVVLSLPIIIGWVCLIAVLCMKE